MGDKEQEIVRLSSFVFRLSSLLHKEKRMILLLDNYDSFTYNLYQYLCELGADVVVKRNDEVSVQDVAAMGPEKIVISSTLR